MSLFSLLIISFTLVIGHGLLSFTRYNRGLSVLIPDRVRYYSPLRSLSSHLCSSSNDHNDGSIAVDVDGDDSDDSDISPALYKKLLDTQIVLSLTAKGSQAFDFFRTKTATINPVSLYEWEKVVDNLSQELSQLTNKDALLAVYASLLANVAATTLDPLQMATFQLLSNAVMDTLIKLRPPNTPITDLIDEITDIHLDFLETFQKLIDADGGEDSYTQTSQQEYLCYQLAGLVRRTYARVSRGLGGDFDTSSQTQEMRINSWVSPVYARLERRFVRFIASNAEEQEEEINAASFEKLLNKLKIEINPRYSLSGVTIERPQSPSSSSSSSPSTDEQDDSPVVASSNDPAFFYPAWETASFIGKVMRNVVATLDVLSALESKTMGSFQSDLADRMKPLAKPLEKLAGAYCNIGKSGSMGSSQGSDLVQISVLGEKDLKRVEDMLNIGHAAVAAVYAVWQIRHNIVGVPVVDPMLPKQENGKPGVRMAKDYLRPVVLKSPEAVKESIPKSLRTDVGFLVEETATRLKPSPELEAAAWMSHAVREGASNDFRSLVTYNVDQDQWPENRDAVYIVVLTAVLTDALTSPGEYIDMTTLLENVIALAALEETLGVREARLACAKGYQAALRNAALQLAKQQSNEKGSGLGAVAVSERVKEVERVLGMTLRLEEGVGKRVRAAAFKDSINVILAAASAAEGTQASARSGLREVDAVYEYIAQMLFISPEQAKGYVQPLGMDRFDKALGKIFLSADMAVTILPEMQEEMGKMFQTQVQALAEDVMMNVEQAEKRCVMLAAGVFSTLLEVAWEESRRMNNERTELLIRRAYALTRHPLLLRIAATEGPSMADMGIHLAVSRLGTTPTMDLMRTLENIRARLSGDPNAAASGNSGWGGSGFLVPPSAANEPQFLAFLSTIQSVFMKEYAAASMKRGYTK